MLNLDAPDEKTFARMVDELGIELGLFGAGDPHIYYVKNLSAKEPELRKRKPKKRGSLFGRRFVEKRIRFGPTLASDQKFTLFWMNKVGYGELAKKRYVTHFYSNELVAELRRLEREFIKDAELKTVKRTTFGVREVKGKHQPFVKGVEFHAAKKEAQQEKE